jgi:hypothetical protein
LIAGGGSVAAAMLAGCTGVLGHVGGDSDDQSVEGKHEVTVDNGTEESHTVNVLVTNEDGDALLDHTFPMDPMTGDEDVVFAGTPAEVTVTIDEDVVKEFPWDPSDEDLPSRIENECSHESLRIHVGSAFDNPDDGPDVEDSYSMTGFYVSFGCSYPDA